MTQQPGPATSQGPDQSVVLPGGFISEADAFADAPPHLRHVVKLMYRPTVLDDGSLSLEFSTDAVVLDYSDVNPDDLDSDTVTADCDLIKRIAGQHPEQIRKIFKEMQRGTREGMDAADRLATDIGLTEGEALKAGGGFIWVVGLLLLAGCAHGNSNKPFKATTTPKRNRSLTLVRRRSCQKHRSRDPEARVARPRAPRTWRPR
jgi:hypothetical protein